MLIRSVEIIDLEPATSRPVADQASPVDHRVAERVRQLRRRITGLFQNLAGDEPA